MGDVEDEIYMGPVTVTELKALFSIPPRKVDMRKTTVGIVSKSYADHDSDDDNKENVANELGKASSESSTKFASCLDEQPSGTGTEYVTIDLNDSTQYLSLKADSTANGEDESCGQRLFKDDGSREVVDLLNGSEIYELAQIYEEITAEDVEESVSIVEEDVVTHRAEAKYVRDELEAVAAVRSNDSFTNLMHNDSFDGHFIHKEIQTLIDTIVLSDDDNSSDVDIKPIVDIIITDCTDDRSDCCNDAADESDCFNDTADEIEKFLREAELKEVRKEPERTPLRNKPIYLPENIYSPDVVSKSTCSPAFAPKSTYSPAPALKSIRPSAVKPKSMCSPDVVTAPTYSPAPEPITTIEESPTYTDETKSRKILTPLTLNKKYTAQTTSKIPSAFKMSPGYGTPKSSNRSQATPEFKMPVKPMTRSGAFKSPMVFKNVVSPVGVYIRNTTTNPAIRNLCPKEMVEKWEPLPEAVKTPTPNNKHRDVARTLELPIKRYQPARQVLIAQDNELNLPESIKKLTKNALDCEVVKHEGRIKREEYFTVPSCFDTVGDSSLFDTTGDSCVMDASVGHTGDVSMVVKTKGVKPYFTYN